MSQVEIYTDGACRGNPGPGGWAAILKYGKRELEISGAEFDTTNNRMELTAAIRALATLKRSCNVELFTDSIYVKQGITAWLPRWKERGWKTAARKPVKNADLWEVLDQLNSQHTIQWHWVRGHTGVDGNERADLLANLAIDEMLKSETG